MSRTLQWDEAARLADQITLCPDGGAWHARVEVTAGGTGYAVAVRLHNTHTWYHVFTMEEFVRVCGARKQP